MIWRKENTGENVEMPEVPEMRKGSEIPGSGASGQNSKTLSQFASRVPGFFKYCASVISGPALFRGSVWMGVTGATLLFLTSLFALFNPASARAWFFFIAQNGLRQQWVFGSGCNSSSRPITVTYDTDDPSNGNIVYGNLVKSVHDEWNQDSGSNVNIMTDITTNGANITYFAMNVNSVNAYLQNPTPGLIRVVYDADGAVLRNLGVDPDNVLGIGVPLAIDSSRPNEICSGIMILNGHLLDSLGSTQKQQYYRYTLLHELGHVLGFAHSIAGDNIQSTGVQASTSDFVPVMHPFAPNPPSVTKTLTDDEKAGLITVYGQ
ncbi:MAG TPA: hypothetical protein DEA96_09495 [Leptospiraceae bacterium]|nr:hypothetical protein [Spirochaetaceae bacterium]HBS05187.1 hypothetical protein [Leptospiraceae bacterium]|tara:strand:- start:57496 stop:58455 length:960 start_codon:yes stop_codon:yes gene_type:complete